MHNSSVHLDPRFPTLTGSDKRTDSLPPNSFGAELPQFVARSRFRQISPVPRIGPEPGSRFTFHSPPAAGSVAEMLDQAAARCGTFVTAMGARPLTMTANYLYAATGSSCFFATAGLLVRDKRLGSHYRRNSTDERGTTDRFGRPFVVQLIKGHHSVHLDISLASPKCPAPQRRRPAARLIGGLCGAAANRPRLEKSPRR